MDNIGGGAGDANIKHKPCGMGIKEWHVRNIWYSNIASGVVRFLPYCFTGLRNTLGLCPRQGAWHIGLALINVSVPPVRGTNPTRGTWFALWSQGSQLRSNGESLHCGSKVLRWATNPLARGTWYALWTWDAQLGSKG